MAFFFLNFAKISIHFKGKLHFVAVLKTASKMQQFLKCTALCSSVKGPIEFKGETFCLAR